MYLATIIVIIFTLIYCYFHFTETELQVTPREPLIFLLRNIEPGRTDQITQPFDEQNVHETTVRSDIWEKFYFLKEWAREDLREQGLAWYSNLQENSMAEAYSFATKQEKNERNKLIILLNEISKAHSISSTRSLTQTEKEVFALVWYRFVRCNLDLATLKLQLLDCFEEGYNLVCITGRISRYINALSGLDKEEILAQPEITQSVLFREALGRAKHYYDHYFNKNKHYIPLRDNGESNDVVLEQRYAAFLEKIKKRIAKKLAEEFPALEEEHRRNVLKSID